MEPNEITERNKAIAYFYATEKDTHMHAGKDCEYFLLPNILNEDDGNWHNEHFLKFHSSWDWLMPVVEKIESIKPRGEDYRRVKSMYSVEINHNTCFIRESIWAGERFEITKLNGSSKIEAVFLAVSDFCLNHKGGNK